MTIACVFGVLFVLAALVLACYLVAFVRAHEAMGRED